MNLIPKQTQESLLRLIAFDDAGKTACALIPLDTWDAPYRPIARRLYTYWEHYHSAPGDNVIDIFADVNGDLRELVLRIYGCGKMEQNAQYLLSRATAFVRAQRLRRAIARATEHIQSGDVDRAESVLWSSLRDVVDVCDIGIDMRNVESACRVLRDEAAESIMSLGIAALDVRRFVPKPKELFLFIGPPKSGKTWFLVHVGKRALLSRCAVVHVTLEMSEAKTAQRYVQSMLALTNREVEPIVSVLRTDAVGRVEGIDRRVLPLRSAMREESHHARIRDAYVQVMAHRPPLWIKEFPTGALTVRGLEAYLDLLEMRAGVVPQVVIVDYGDLFRLPVDEYRVALGRLFRDLRGVAVRRSLALVTATQANRVGARADTVTTAHVAEDFSRIATADVVITYSQTDVERTLGLARLHVGAGRGDEDKITIVIAQSYALGQFALSSALAPTSSWESLVAGAASVV